MKKRVQHFSIFDKICIIIACLVVVFITVLMLSIVVQGAPYIGAAFQSKEVIFAVKLSLSTASLSTILCIFIAIPTAYALTKTNMPFKNILFVLIEMPLSLPYLVLGLSLLLVFSTGFGKFLSANGIPVIFSRNGIILAHMIVNLPFVIRIIKTGFSEVDYRLEYIARMLGATKGKTFWTITLPMTKSTILGAVILAWSRALGEFGATLMLVGVTRMKTETLPASIYLNMATGDVGAAMSSALLLLTISVISQGLFYLINNKKQESRLHIS
jgi:molybdate transport system permease protein